MPIPLYLAQTATEFASTQPPLTHLAWMACHFSPYNTGITNIPETLPANSLLILNDRTPPQGHDPKRIKESLEEAVHKLNCSGILLDFQRPGYKENEIIANVLSEIDCPIAISETYAKCSSCAVFLPPVPPHKSLEKHIENWREREIWLEVALDCIRCTVTQKGTQFTSATVPNLNAHIDSRINCHYHIDIQNDSVIFSIWRTLEDVKNLLRNAESLGICRAIGLWQELKKDSPAPP